MHPRLRILGLLAAAGFVLIAAAKFILPLAAPFVAGLIVASLLEPVVSWCEKTCRCPRWLAVGGVLAVSVLALGLVLCWIGAHLWLNLRDLALGEQGRQMAAFVERLARSGTAAMGSLPEPLRRALLQAAHELPLRALEVVRQILGGLSRLPECLGLLFLGLIAAYFFCRDRDRIARFIVTLTPREWRAKAAEMRAELIQALVGYVRTQILLVGMAMCLGIAGLKLLGIRQAWLLGCLLGLLDLLPMIGPGAMLLPWAGAMFAMGDWAKGLGLVIIFAVSAIAREAVQARLLGGNLGLHPLATLAAIYLGLKVLGFSGVLIGPILLVVLRAFHAALVLPSKA